jgi:hypothetical protein
VGGDGNKGIFDMLLYKRSFKNTLMMWGLSTFKEEPEALEWIQEVVAKKVLNFATWGKVWASSDVTWRAGRNTAQIAWLNFMVEVTFGTGYDAPLKVALKAGQKPEEAIDKDVFLVVVEAIQNKMQKKPPPPNEEDPKEAQDENGAENSDVEFQIPGAPEETGAAGEQTKKTVKTSEMDAETGAEVRRITKEVRVQLRAQVQLLSLLVEDKDKTSTCSARTADLWPSS